MVPQTKDDGESDGTRTYGADPFAVALQDSPLRIGPAGSYRRGQPIVFDPAFRATEMHKLVEQGHLHWRVRCARYVGLITILTVCCARQGCLNAQDQEDGVGELGMSNRGKVEVSDHMTVEAIQVSAKLTSRLRSADSGFEVISAFPIFDNHHNSPAT